MELKKDAEPEKLRGAYFTPEAITTPVVRMTRAVGWVHGRVLEPSCGDGAFLKPLSKKMETDLEIDAVELNDESFEIANERFAKLQGFNLYHGDFFDFIAGSVAHHNLSDSVAVTELNKNKAAQIP